MRKKQVLEIFQFLDNSCNFKRDGKKSDFEYSDSYLKINEERLEKEDSYNTQEKTYQLTGYSVF